MLIALFIWAHLQSALASEPPPDSVIPFDPTIPHGTLPNGLAWYVERGTYPRARAELRLAVKAGAVDEAKSEYGLAHLIEHMAFQGSGHFQPNELVSYMESIGMKFGADTNAYTNMNETVYKLAIPTDHPEALEKGLTWFADVAGALDFTPERMEHERSVVLEEWRRQQGARQRGEDTRRPLLFAGTPYASHDTIGTEASIASLTVDQATAFWKKWYRPGSMAVAVAGDVDAAEAEALITRVFGGIRAGRAPSPRTSVPNDPSLRVRVVSDVENKTTSIKVYTVLDRPVYTTYAEARANVAESVVVGTLGIRLGEASVLPDASFTSARPNLDRVSTRLATCWLYAQAKDGQVGSAIDALLTARKSMVKYGPTSGELIRVSAIMNSMLDTMVNGAATEGPGPRVEELLRNFLTHEPVTGPVAEAARTRETLGTLTSGELRAAAARMFPDEGMLIWVAGPKGAALPFEGELRSIAASVTARDIPPPVDAPPPPELMTTLPDPGRVVGTREIPGLASTLWTLSNGARVVVRPSQEKPDEVLFRAWSTGGMARYPAADVVPARTAVDIALWSGLGGLDAVSLARSLAGKQASATPFLDPGEEGLTGSAVPADLETMLRLAYLRFTAPVFDPSAVEVSRQRRAENLRHRLDDPGNVFSDRIIQLIWGDAPWRRSWTVTDLDAMNLTRSEAIYRERFGNAADFVFAFAGAVDPATLQPLVERYIGSLPGTPVPAEPVGDDGARPTRGVHTESLALGTAPRATVAMRFDGEIPYSPEVRTALGGMGDALELRLRDAIREEEAGTYTIDVKTRSWARPWSGYEVSVQFDCDPARREALTARVMSILHDARTTPLPDDLVAKVREARLRNYETDARKNSFWLDEIRHVYIDGEAEDVASTLTARIAAITPAAVMAMAQRTLDFDNYVAVDRAPAN